MIIEASTITFAFQAIGNEIRVRRDLLLLSLQEDFLEVLSYVSYYTSVTKFPHMIKPVEREVDPLPVRQFSQIK